MEAGAGQKSLSGFCQPHRGLQLSSIHLPARRPWGHDHMGSPCLSRTRVDVALTVSICPRFSSHAIVPCCVTLGRWLGFSVLQHRGWYFATFFRGSWED